MGQLVGARVQLSIAQPFIFQNDRHCIRRSLNLRFKKLVRAQVILVMSARVVQVEQQFASFGVSQERQFGDTN